MEEYSPEIEALQRNLFASVSPKSSLYYLNPFIDANGILREQMFEQKHPAILPRKSHLAKLAVHHYHNKVFHQGRQITYGTIRNAGLWIVGAKRMVSTIIDQYLQETQRETVDTAYGRLTTRSVGNATTLYKRGV